MDPEYLSQRDGHGQLDRHNNEVVAAGNLRKARSNSSSGNTGGMDDGMTFGPLCVSDMAHIVPFLSGLLVLVVLMSLL